jgi:hypothetical protein
MTALGGFSPGDVLTAADLNAIGATTSWTPSFSFGVTVGNGTVAGNYQRVNNLVIAQARFTLGSTSTVSTFVRADLPVTAGDAFDVAIGTSGFLVDLDTGVYYKFSGRPYSNAAVYLYGDVQNASNTSINLSTTLAPITYATGDQIYWQMIYRAG